MLPGIEVATVALGLILLTITKKDMKNIIFLIGLVLSINAASAKEVLINGGFETGSLSPWLSDSGSPAITTFDAHTGNYSVAAFSLDRIRQNFSGVAVADIAEVSFWAKRQGGPYDLVQFYYADGSSNFTLVNGIRNPEPNVWNFFDVTSSLISGMTLTGFSIYGTSPGPALLDDFSIKEKAAEQQPGDVPEPATVALIGLGLLGFAASRRKSAK